MSCLRFIPDATYLKVIYRIKVGKTLNLKNPKTYTEKLQWLKLHDRKPIYSTMVDKFEAKQYIASIVGEEHVIPTLGVWDNFDEIDFDALPDKFVLKCTHDSGGLVICKDAASNDIVNVTFLLLVGYLVSAICCLYNYKLWAVSLHISTVFVVLLGIGSFLIGASVGKRIKIKRFYSEQEMPTFALYLSEKRIHIWFLMLVDLFCFGIMFI